MSIFKLDTIENVFETMRMLQQVFLFRDDTIKQMRALNIPDDFII